MKKLLSLIEYLPVDLNIRIKNLNLINKNLNLINLKYMKKLIYILILVVTSIATFSSCTEENVTPKTTGGSNGSATKGA